MAKNQCPQCGAPVGPEDFECPFCGEKLTVQPISPSIQPQPAQQPYAPQPQIIIQQWEPQSVYLTGISPSWPIKNKTAAALLAIFLGTFGIHKFYLGKVFSGILYILFFWSGLPTIIGLIEGLIYLCSNDENFQLKHHVRLK